jgi:hypothetical protein
LPTIFTTPCGPVPYRDPAQLVTPYVGTGLHNMLPYVSREVLANTLWPGTSALDHTFTFKGWKESYHVIGVSREVRSSTVLDPLNDLPEFYTPPVTLGSSQVSVGIRCSEVCPDETVIRERVRAPALSCSQ